MENNTLSDGLRWSQSRLWLLRSCQMLGEDGRGRDVLLRKASQAPSSHLLLLVPPNSHRQADSYSSLMITSGPSAMLLCLQRAGLSPFMPVPFLRHTTMPHNLEKECLRASICVVPLAVPQRRNSLTLPGLDSSTAPLEPDGGRVCKASLWLLFGWRSAI